MLSTSLARLTRPVRNVFVSDDPTAPCDRMIDYIDHATICRRSHSVLDRAIPDVIEDHGDILVDVAEKQADFLAVLDQTSQ